MNEVTGIVKKVERVNECLSFFTLLPHPEAAIKMWDEIRIPIYVNVKEDYVGLPVNVFTKRKGFLWTDFEQMVNTEHTSKSIEMPYSAVQRINSSYSPLREK